MATRTHSKYDGGWSNECKLLHTNVGVQKLKAYMKITLSAHRPFHINSSLERTHLLSISDTSDNLLAKIIEY